MTTDGYKSEVKILVVDDDPSIGQLMADFLHNEGYQPVIYSQPQEALRFSIKNKFGPPCEVVSVTGYGSFDNAVQALKIGAYDYLRKPFGVNELNLCLKRFQERQALKEQVQVAEQRYFHLVQNIPSLVFVIYKDLSLEFINRACEAMLGYTPEEAMGDPKWFQERVHSSDFERIRRLLFSAFQSHNSRFSAECRLIHRDGHLIHAMVGSIALTKSEKDLEVDRLQCMIVDITDRVFLEKAVIQKEKLKILGSISAEVAHEIRNPLVSIGGFARRLRKRFPELPEGDIILSESERLEKMLV